MHIISFVKSTLLDLANDQFFQNYVVWLAKLISEWLMTTN